MFKRVRQLHISLAAKCQLLFGAAVVLIIGAALFVPWQRMEQLTEQLNERSARTLIDYTIDNHVAHAHKGELSSETDTPPTTLPGVPVIPATPRPIGGPEGSTPPRLILAGAGRDDMNLTPFERRAV